MHRIPLFAHWKSMMKLKQETLRHPQQHHQIRLIYFCKPYGCQQSLNQMWLASIHCHSHLTLQYNRKYTSRFSLVTSVSFIPTCCWTIYSFHQQNHIFLNDTFKYQTHFYWAFTFTDNITCFTKWCIHHYINTSTIIQSY